MSKQVTIYNGTFTKVNGNPRTMTFIRRGDLPSSLINETVINNLEGRSHCEVVYDVEARAFRQFNWNTVQGEVSKSNTTFTF